MTFDGRIAVAAAATAWLACCGPRSGGSSGPRPTKARTRSKRPDGSRAQGVLRIRLANPLAHLNPLITNKAWVRRIAVPNVLETLLTIDPVTGDFRGALAVRFKPIREKVKVPAPRNTAGRKAAPAARPLPGGGVEEKEQVVGYLFELRKAVRWHDGRPLTAADAAFTLRRAISDTDVQNAIPGGALLRGALSKVDVISDRLFEVRTTRPFGPLLEVLSEIPILPKHRYESCERLVICAETNKEVVGTGPFKVVQWWPVEKVVLARNERYWGSRPSLERLEVHYVASVEDAAEKMRDGGLEMLTDFTTQEYRWVEKRLLKGKDADRFNRVVAFPPAVANLYFNWVKLEFREPRVRRAVALLLNKARLARMQPGGSAPLLEHPVWLRSYQYALVKLPRWRMDERTATALLDQAGWRRGPDGYRRKSGQILELVTVVPDGASTMLRFWKLTRMDFKKAGIKLRVDVVPFGHFIKALRSVRFHLLTVVVAQPAPWSSLFSALHSSMRYSGTNFGRISDKRLDRMLEKWVAEPDLARRRGLERDVLSRVRKITAVLPLYSPPLVAVVARSVRNLEPGGQWWRFDRVQVHTAR